ncbi:MAG: hypothetical protein GY951_11585 [Psychromonas sp.]|nr:hypothetical protein [Psychromonas sp.]
MRTTSSCNSRLVSANFSCAILDHFLNSIGIIAEIVIFQEKHRQQHLKISMIIATFALLTFTYLHLQTEHIYGEEILEQWYAQHPEQQPK